MRPFSSLVLLSAVALASGACSDSANTTAPVVSGPVAAIQAAAAAKPRPRAPYISAIDLSSIYVPISGGFTPYTVTVINPTSKDWLPIYLKGELKSQNNQPPVPASAFLAFCPFPNGVVPRGASCTMSDGITGGATLAPGPGTFTLRLLQQQTDGTMTVLDTRTVDVVLRQF